MPYNKHVRGGGGEEEEEEEEEEGEEEEEERGGGRGLWSMSGRNSPSDIKTHFGGN